ncbi:hypothetical protein RUND412_007905 [Rhizina undulata]
MVNIFRVKKDPSNPSPPEIYNWRIYVLAVCASFGSAMFGYDSAFIGGTLNLPSFERVFGLEDGEMTESQRSALEANIVSTFQAGAFCGAILVYWMNERFGRRISLMTAGCIFNVGVILQLVSNGHTGLMYGGRAFTGLGVGSSSLVIPQFISECSPPAIRGGLVGLFEVALQFGTVIGFWVNYAVSETISSEGNKQWHIPVAIQFVPASLMIIGMTFMIESPRWLFKKGHESAASKSLTWLRNLPETHPYIQQELSDYRFQLSNDQHSTPTSLLDTFRATICPQMRLRLFVGCALMFAQNFTGINALNYFSPSIFSSIGFTGTSASLLATGVYGIMKTLAATMCFMLVVDRFGRRPLLLCGSCVCTFAMFYLAGYTSLSNSFHGGGKKDAAGYSAIVMIYIYACGYGFSWNLPWLICAEIFPTHVRSLAMVFTTCSQWLSQFIIVYSTPYMLSSIESGTFIFFGGMTVFAIFWIFFLLPETKGIPLEDMDLLWNAAGTARAKRAAYEDSMLEKEDGNLKISATHVESA